MHAEHESAQTDECGEARSGRDERGLHPSATGQGDREGERRGKEERGGIGRVTGRERGSRDRGRVGRDRWSGPIEHSLREAGGEAAERQRDEGSHRQTPMPATPPQPEPDHHADDEQRNEASDRAQDPGHTDQPVGAVFDEPAEHCLVTGDETAPIEDVFGDQDEQHQAGRREDSCDGQRAAGRDELGAKWHATEPPSPPNAGVTSGNYGAVFRATRSDRCCSELSRWSCPNGGNWRYSRTSGGTADQSYVSVTVVRDGPVASRS